MTEKQLDISRRTLIERIKAESGKSALVKQSAGQPDRLSTHTIVTENEREIIDDYISTAVNECAVTVEHYLGRCRREDKNDGTISLCVTIPENYPEEAVPILEDIVKNIVVNRCLQLWYMLVRADDGNACANKIQLHMKQLQETLALRKRPS